MQPTLINGFYLATNSRIGSWHVSGGTPSAEQINNANAIKSFLVDGEGWSLEAVCAILGNMMGESTINPAFIQETNRRRLPNNASSLSDVPNSVMQNFYKEYYGDSNRAYGIGLVQWDGYTDSAGTDRQKLVNYAIVNNFDWYDGWTQLYRLRFEQANDYKYHFFRATRVGGVVYTFDNFPYSSASVSDLTKAWSWGYERNSGGPDDRIADAQWWYNFFTGSSAPEPIDPEYPERADPNLPYDPDHPIDPDEDAVVNIVTILLLYMSNRKRKELKPRCLKI